MIPYEIMRASSILKACASAPTALEHIARGLEWVDAEFVARKLGVSLDRFAGLTGVPRSTFFRRQAEGRFTPRESECIMRFAHLWRIACEIFPGETAARSWLDRPQVGLEGAVPLEFARSELGARMVEELMLRIHRGILA